MGNVRKLGEHIEADNSRSKVEVYFVGRDSRDVDVPVAEPHFSSELSEPIGLSTGKMRDLIEIRAVIDRERGIYDQLLAKSGESAPALNAIETTLGWDTIYEPEEQRVISPVNRA